MSDHIPASQEAMQQQRILATFGAFALKAHDFDEILHEACRLVGQALHTDLAKVMELQPDRKTLLVRAGVGWIAGVVGRTTVQASIDSSEGLALQTLDPVASDDIATEKRFVYAPFLTENGVHALVNVIILGADGQPPYGLLEVDSRTPRRFTEDDMMFLQTYANMLAAAVDRFQLVKALQQAVTEKERLLTELQHRIKNNLQVITALISTQSRRTHSSEAKQELRSIGNRIETLRLVHDKLYTTGEVDRVDLAPYLAELSEGLLKFHGHAAGNIRLRIELARVYVTPEIAIPLGLIINEFVTNSMKYAFDDQGGVVTLELVTNGDKAATLTLSDNGRGFTDLSSGGTGMRLINGLLAQLGTQAHWHGEGGVRLVFELPRLAMI
jgi:two-component sensor histidine kinase